MIRRAVPPSLLAACLLLLSACAERPFVDAYPSQLSLMPNEAMAFDVCHGDGDDPAEIRRLAQEVCAERGLNAQSLYGQRWQCRVTVPHLTRFKCI